MSQSQVLTVEEVTIGTDVQFDTVGTFYYSCSMTGHCAAGQKLTVEVKDSSEGMSCHDHELSGGSGGALGMTCGSGEVSAYMLGNADYGATSDQCSQLCTTPTALGWMPAKEGSCADAGFPEKVAKKSVQPAGSPMAVEVVIHVASSVSPTCHCHSYEEIQCSSQGDSLYDEHIVEIQTYCQGIVDGSDNICPYLCFQPFEILHLHYLACDMRPKHELYKQIDATKKCHQAAKPPYNVQCDKVEESEKEGMTTTTTTAKATTTVAAVLSHASAFPRKSLVGLTLLCATQARGVFG
jgi:hypothetical protein